MQYGIAHIFRVLRSKQSAGNVSASGRSAAWLARLPWEQEVGSSNRSPRPYNAGGSAEHEMKNADCAASVLKEGFNCAQAVFSTLAPGLGLEAGKAAKIASFSAAGWRAREGRAAP